MDDIAADVALGSAVRGYLARPAPDPVLIGAVAVERRVETLLHGIESLCGVRAISETQRDALTKFVSTGAPAAIPLGDDAFPIGAVLITTAERYPYYGGVMPDVYAALAVVVDTSLEVWAAGGPDAAYACSAIASVRALRRGDQQ